MSQSDQLVWLLSLVAEVSAHLGSGPTYVTPPDAHTFRDPPRTLTRWEWGNVRRFLIVSHVDTPAGQVWTLRAQHGTRLVMAETGGDPPTADDVRRVLETVGLLPPGETTRLRQVCEQYRAASVEVREALAAALGVDPADDLTDVDMVARLRAQVDALGRDDLDDDDAVHGYFGLSYANYLVLHRTLMQSMPDGWQRRVVALLREYDEAFAHIERPDAYRVEAAREVEYGELTNDEMAQLGIIRRRSVEHPSGVIYRDRDGEEHEHWERTLLPLPGGDPVPHYSRGRTRVAPRTTARSES